MQLKILFDTPTFDGFHFIWTGDQAGIDAAIAIATDAARAGGISLEGVMLWALLRAPRLLREENEQARDFVATAIAAFVLKSAVVPDGSELIRDYVGVCDYEIVFTKLEKDGVDYRVKVLPAGGLKDNGLE